MSSHNRIDLSELFPQGGYDYLSPHSATTCAIRNSHTCRLFLCTLCRKHHIPLGQRGFPLNDWDLGALDRSMGDPQLTQGSQLKAPLPSQMTQLDDENGSRDADITTVEEETPTGLPRKRRPWSAQDFKSILSPSPSFTESRRSSKDDLDVTPAPVTPKRPNVPARGLSLQMPPRDVSSTSTANLTKKIPISPKPESSASYPSPASVLPRRSRGMDFARAATNLHHSTLAESSPESSPVVGSRSGMMPRKGLFIPPGSMAVPDSPSMIPNTLWSTMANVEKSQLSSSVGSSNMMEYESGSSSSDCDAIMDAEDDDTIHMTPQAYNTVNGFVNPFGAPLVNSPGGDGVGEYSPAASKLMSYQRARVKARKNRMSSGSASAHSSMCSPGPSSPPLLRSIESNMNGGYFPDEIARKEVNSRRESLSLGTNDMQLSDAEQSEDGGELRRIHSHEDVPIPAPVTPSIEERRSVIRRAVTRRTNMLPKPKGFARIRAALLEEGAPIDTEVKREAEVIRQVRDSDADNDLNIHPSQPTTSASSPSLAPATTEPLDSVEPISEDVSMGSERSYSRRSSSTFTNQAIRNSAGSTFWNNFDQRMRTPPPTMPRDSSSGVSDDINMDTPNFGSQLTPQHILRPSRSQESLITATQNITYEIPRKGNKRMRDDDFDPNYFKRRAVSPGLSLQNSPTLPQSPLQRDGGWGFTPKSGREVPSVHVSGERVSSNGSASGSASGGTPGASKRVGLQGMTDTHDGLMNMSIE